MLGFESLPTAIEPWCFIQCSMGTIGYYESVSEVIKKSGTTESRTRTYRLRNFCPNTIAEVYFRKKNFGRNRLKKKKNESTE